MKIPFALRILITVGFSLKTTGATALDQVDNLHSRQSLDVRIAESLKQTARELNLQTPVKLDEETEVMSVIALQKTITFNMRLTNYSASQADPSIVLKTATENLNHTVCLSEATRDLIDLGVKYRYQYFGNDGKLITRVLISEYNC